MKEALSSSETSVLIWTTLRNIPEDAILLCFIRPHFKAITPRNFWNRLPGIKSKGTQKTEVNDRKGSAALTTRHPSVHKSWHYISSTSGGRSVSIVRLRTKGHWVCQGTLSNYIVTCQGHSVADETWIYLFISFDYDHDKLRSHEIASSTACTFTGLPLRPTGLTLLGLEFLPGPTSRLFLYLGLPLVVNRIVVAVKSVASAVTEGNKRRRMPSSRMLRRVALSRTYVSEERSASIISVTRIVELGTTLALTSNRRTLRRNSKFVCC
jgi:hypothetical protein